MQRNTQNGFTLIELLIAVAIVGILARIAYPSYVESVTKSKRADAKAALLELSVFMERYYTTNGCYNVPTAGACVTSNAAPALPFATTPKSGKANYDLTVSAVSPTSYTLTAAPRTTAPDSLCDSLTLTNTGVKGESGTGTASDCW